jgi:two-component system sensor histidine kinase BarA
VPQLRAACQRSETLLKQDSTESDKALDDLENAITRLEIEARVSA